MNSVPQFRCSPRAVGFGLAAIVCFFFLNSLAHADTIYASSADGTIYKFDSSGNGSVFAYIGLGTPEGLVFDSSGDLYVATSGYNTIEKFDSSGHESIFANSGLNDPQGLAFDNSGNLYVANAGNNTIERFNPSGTCGVSRSAECLT